MSKATVRPVTDGKGFELLLDGFVIGTSKLQCDAELYAHKINDAIDDAGREAYDNGYNEGHDNGYSEGYDDGYVSGEENAE